AARHGPRPAGHRADGAGREQHHRRLLARRGGVPGRRRCDLAPRRRHHHRRQPQSDVPPHRGGGQLRGSVVAARHWIDPGREDDGGRRAVGRAARAHGPRRPGLTYPRKVAGTAGPHLPRDRGTTMTDFNETATPPPEPPPVAPGTPSAEERQWAMFAHLSALVGGILTSGWAGSIGCFIGPLIIWLVKKDTMPFVDDQGKEAPNFHIT